MANKTNNGRMTHVSPGIYFQETDLSVAAKSLGITSLGLVGETVKGPAFEVVPVGDFGEYQRYFGGTNTEHFRGSNYPKYELPYIAQEYLKQSNNLKVVRILGLSGVNAGTAWVLTAYDSNAKSEYTKDKPLVIGVLRSRGEHKDAAWIASADPDNGICEDQYEYDKIQYYASAVEMVASPSLAPDDKCQPGFNRVTGEIVSNVNNLGTFTLKVTTYLGEVKNYAVSLNPNERNYIINVLGVNPEIGDTEIFVEELYDIALRQLVEEGKLNALGLTTIEEVNVVPAHAPVTDILTKDESTLTRRDVGKRFIYTQSSVNEEDSTQKLKVHVRKKDATSGLNTWVAEEGKIGHIYTVVGYTNSNGTRSYYYGEEEGNVEEITTARDFKNVLGKVGVGMGFSIFDNAVECLADNLYYVMEGGNILPITVDWHNYKEAYRYASTPWIVSELKGSAEHVELVKLFRFHTISDGVNANTEVKVSIENIDPDYGTFDVIVRDFNDTDASVVALERYRQCSMVPGTANYIGLMIGTSDGKYERKSSYITVEVNETTQARVSIPAGFLGYPVRNVEGLSINKGVAAPKLCRPYFKYNTGIDQDVRINRQYFGISDITGIDEDILKYKGVEAYNDMPMGLSPCFHLDSRILNGVPDEKGVVTQYGIQQTVSVDGVTGYEWCTVGIENMTAMGIEPRIGDSDTMVNTIYEDKRYRKFSVVFYGGWDGWDYYRTARSTADKFKFEKYRGKINMKSGVGTQFSLLREPEKYGFDATDKATTADWYAYLSAIRKFSNPKSVDINVLATPGIDYVNNQLLVEEVIDMVENERADSVYVVTTPDKPFGAGDGVNEMFTADDAVANLEDTQIDSNYTTTFFPWVKCFDAANNQYIFLPPTKDIVRNFAFTDNVAYPWFAAAGWNRGDISAIGVRQILKVGQTDKLYDNRINYVNNFAEDGMKLWGDRNLQIRESPLNRTSKRRMLIRVRKLLSIACIGIVFDPNDNGSVDTLRSAMKKVLDDVVTKRGIVDYRLIIDDSEEARARLSIPAVLKIKPMPNVEYIDINIELTPYGASFDDV